MNQHSGIKATTFAKQKATAGLKREFKTNPVGTMGRFIVMGGLIFMTYSIVMFDGNFGMAIDHISMLINKVKG